jgi:hypothetical protein
MVVPEAGSGRCATASGESNRVGTGNLVTYTVEVERGLELSPTAFAQTVDAVLGDRRGWTAVESRSLQRVSHDPMVRIRLATPATTDSLCAPLDTGGRLSCRNGDLVVLNAWRWVNGADAYDGNLAGYRRYMVNHEFGHALGNGHRSCPDGGAPAPVMVQQTKGLDGCTANPWPATTNGLLLCNLVVHGGVGCSSIAASGWGLWPQSSLLSSLAFPMASSRRPSTTG